MTYHPVSPTENSLSSLIIGHYVLCLILALKQVV